MHGVSGNGLRQMDIDSVLHLFQIRHVQPVRQVASPLICRTHLETRVQPPQGRLNTCLTCNACAVASRESYPHRAIGVEIFKLLNRDTASCHSGCRNMVGPPSGGTGANVVRWQQSPRRGERKRPAVPSHYEQLRLRFSFSFFIFSPVTARRVGPDFFRKSQGGWGFSFFPVSFLRRLRATSKMPSRSNRCI